MASSVNLLVKVTVLDSPNPHRLEGLGVTNLSEVYQ